MGLGKLWIVGTCMVVLFGAFIASLHVDPPPIDTRRIEEHGTEYLKLPDGRLLEYFLTGSNSASPIHMLYFHSFGNTAKQASLWEAEFQQYDVRVLSLSIPGFGFSSPYPISGPLRTLEDSLEDIELLLNHVGWDQGPKPYIVGYSYGSLEAASACLHFSHTMGVSGCALLHPMTPTGMSEEVGLAIDPVFETVKKFMAAPYTGDAIASLMKLVGPKTFLEHLCPDGPVMINAFPPEFFTKVVEEMDNGLAVSVRGFVDGARVIHSTPRFPYEDIDVKNVLIVTTEDDETNPPQFAEFIAKAIPSARLEFLPNGAGHAQVMMKMGDVLRSLLGFQF